MQYVSRITATSIESSCSLCIESVSFGLLKYPIIIFFGLNENLSYQKSRMELKLYWNYVFMDSTYSKSSDFFW